MPGATALIHMSRKLYAVCRGQLLTTARKQSKTQVAELDFAKTMQKRYVIPIQYHNVRNFEYSP